MEEIIRLKAEIKSREVTKWDKRFLDMCLYVAKWSKDPSSQFGAIIVGPKREIIATGYNGPPRGFPDDKEGINERPQKYFYYEHAERNALYNSVRRGICVEECTMYAHAIPCSDCCRGIIQSGISRLVVETIGSEDYLSRWQESVDASLEMLRECGVILLVNDKDSLKRF